jgi:ribosomal protein S1
VKLLFNYGIFVTVKWVEWLLHKNEMIVPEWVSWKKFFNLWDSIQIKAKEKKEINGKLSVVWTML